MPILKFPTALACLFSLGLPSFGQPVVPKSQKGDNAALKYYQAFELLPKQRPETAKLFNEDWNIVPLDSAIVKILEESGNALRLSHRAAQMQHCDWGLDYEDGPETLMPYLQKARELTRFTCLRARYRFETGKHNDAVDDVLDTFALAQHVGHKSPLISLLVSFAIEQIVIDSVARQLPKIDAKVLDRLVTGLGKLPPGGTLHDSLLADKELGTVWLKKQIRGGDDQTGVYMKIGLPLGLLGGKSPIKLLEELDPFYDEFGKVTSLSLEEATTRIAELKKKIDTNPFGKLLFPAVQKVYEADCRMRARRQLLRASIAMAQFGKDKLKDYPDPFGQEPFEFTEFPGGFETEVETHASRQAGDHPGRTAKNELMI